MSVTFFVPAAPTREIPCEYCISARKDAEMSGEHYGYVHPDGSITCEGYCTGRVRESDAGEVNVANANARVYLRILGLDPDDLHGTIEANALPALLQRILVFRARGEAERHAIESFAELNGPGPKIYNFGLTEDQIDRVLSRLQELFAYAVDAGFDVSYG
jgi:hypothetical protein